MPSEPITVNILNNEVRLDNDCWACKYTSYRNKHDVCEMCKGRGYVLTDVGRAIMDLVARHGDPRGA